ncbi:hypothetical protein QYM36_011251 [Artemia franciscana]|uniref:Transmembrane protein n=1 Tax=Artemia franciscana TaxID=6661 RepID=A0AA88HI85_ARTSF|nr:hypothetical protein QYM36_011251 [Artemia franciscana]
MFTKETFKNAIKYLVIPVSCAGISVWQFGLPKSLAIWFPVSSAGIATWKLIKKYRESEMGKWLREEDDNIKKKENITEKEYVSEKEGKIQKKHIEKENNPEKEDTPHKENVVKKENKSEKKNFAEKENERNNIIQEEIKRRILLDRIKENLVHWYEEEVFARSLARIKKKSWTKASKKPEYINSLHDIHLAEIEEKRGIQAVLDVIGRNIKIHKSCIKSLIKKALEKDNYKFHDFKMDILQCFLKSFHQEKKLFCYDSYFSHLNQSFNEKKILYDSEVTCLPGEMNISFTRLQLKEFENEILGTYFKEPLVSQETIMKYILNEFENPFERTILNYYCSYYCPLCKAQCFKKNNHKDRHDCFHITGGAVGHYYLRSNIPGLKRFDSKTIIAKNRYAKFLPFTTKILSNYTCASAPKESKFVFDSKKYKFKDFSIVFKNWATPSKSRAGYYKYLVTKHHFELANKFKLHPYRFEPGEEKYEIVLSQRFNWYSVSTGIAFQLVWRFNWYSVSTGMRFNWYSVSTGIAFQLV